MEPEQAAELRKAFPASQVGKLPKAGLMLDYVGHAAVTDRLLKVDPDWTWKPMGITPAGTPAFDEKGGLWILLTVAGVTRPGYGEPGRIGAKEAIGDAIRNAAMRFGVALDLWAKEDLQSDAPGLHSQIGEGYQAAEAKRAAAANDETSRREGPAAKLITQAQRKKMWATAKGYGLTEDELRGIVKRIADVESTQLIPRYLVDAILQEIEVQALGQASS